MITKRYKLRLFPVFVISLFTILLIIELIFSFMNETKQTEIKSNISIDNKIFNLFETNLVSNNVLIENKSIVIPFNKKDVSMSCSINYILHADIDSLDIIFNWYQNLELFKTSKSLLIGFGQAKSQINISRKMNGLWSIDILTSKNKLIKTISFDVLINSRKDIYKSRRRKI